MVKIDNCNDVIYEKKVLHDFNKWQIATKWKWNIMFKYFNIDDELTWVANKIPHQHLEYLITAYQYYDYIVTLII